MTDIKMTDITAMNLDALLSQIRQCRLCEAHLEPRPVVRASASARLLIIGQAPGTKVHATGIPWNDASGERLRAWLGMDESLFYDESMVAIAPMGFCYPGRGKSGDLPPRPECAEHWHEPLRQYLPKVALTLLVGSYAQAYYLGPNKSATLSDTVAQYQRHLASGYFPLPHPSPRNTLWLKQRPWFEQTVVPALRIEVNRVLDQNESP